MTLEAFLKYPVVFVVGVIVALLVTRAWGPRALRWGWVDHPGGRKIHREPVPVSGGIAIFVAFHAVCAVVFLFPWQPFIGQIPIDWWWRFIPLSLAVLALGLLDDRLGLRPSVKLSGQTVIALAAYFLDIRVQNILGATLPVYGDFIVTIFWFLLLMNSFNLIDGIDGLACGIAFIAALGIALSLVFRREPGDVLLLLGFSGACLGFLRYNFYPARVFLGDTGSLFIGFTLAAIAISTSSKGPAVAAIGMPLLAVGIPLFDTLLAVWRRSMRSIFPSQGRAGAALGVEQADSEHLHHRLLWGGRKHSQVALMLYGATALLVALGIIVATFHDRALGILALAFLIGCYTVVRHLAWIELRDSGEAVLRGIERPVRRNQTLIFYVVADLLILNAALLLTLYGMGVFEEWAQPNFKRAWLRAVPMDVAVPFLFLVWFRSYSRVWYLARISEYMITGLAVVLGYSMACALQMAGQVGGEGMLILRYVFLGGVSMPLIIGVRASLRIVQDLMQWWSRSVHHHGKDTQRAILCGAGFRTTLFLRQIAHGPSRKSALHILGLVDSDEAKRGHFVHGIRVLGTLEELSRVIEEKQPDVLYLVEDVSEAELALVQHAAQKASIPIVRWRIVEDRLNPSAEDA